MACSPLIVVSGMAFEAGLARGEHIQNIYGLDPAKLVSDMERIIELSAAGLLSFGTAAGLSVGLQAGAIVIARHVLHNGQMFEADAGWAAQLQNQFPDAMFADVAGLGQPVKTLQEKAQLHAASGAVAADMESHLVAQVAQKYNLPFTVLRVVLDDAECSLPPAALVATRLDGTIDYAKLAISLLAHPQQIPAMLRLGKCHAAAKKSLVRCGHFLERGGFGLRLG